MNTLSWFLYLAEVLGNVQFACVAGIILAGLGFIPCGIAWCECEDATATQWMKRLFISVLVMAAIGVIIPSKQTMYAIAVSQMGEKIVQSDAVQEVASDATKALRQWIKSQLKEEEKK